MPEVSFTKHVPHPNQRDVVRRCSSTATDAASKPYAEIRITTNFTFLTGASHPEEYVDRAVELGYRGLAITDVNSLAGIVRMHVAAKQHDLSLAVGCHLMLHTVRDRPPAHVLVYPTSRESYGRLCQLLTRGKLRARKGECHLTLHDLLDYQEDMLSVLVPSETIDEHVVEVAQGLQHHFTRDRVSIAICREYNADDPAQFRKLMNLSEFTNIPLAATNDVQYHAQGRKPLHDVLACIRNGCTIDQAGLMLAPNAERYLKPPEEMHRIFAECPEAIARSLDIVERASAFSLDELRYEYPHETCPGDKTPMQHLKELTLAGAASRYANGIPANVMEQLEHEFDLIADLDYPHYFLTVHDIVDFARSKGILCQGRGAAANSAVCFCLGITEVDPGCAQLLFERFVSRERNEPPDIDVDFEHERREEVIQYIYRKYGRHRAALTAEVITYRARSAIREVGKALGLSLDCVDRLAKSHEWFDGRTLRRDHVHQLGLNPDDPTLFRLAVLVGQSLGFPRHLSQHVGGFVLTERPLSETVSIENAAMPDRTVIEWDKDDIDALGMLKVDVLGLGMLTCVRKAIAMVNETRNIETPHEESENESKQTADLTFASIANDPGDPAVYDMICNADTVGVFQIESRAQMSMLPRLRPREFYDLVIEVAIVRPGPIHGGMVHPYLRRRTGEEDITFPSEAVREVLERTLGVPLFQEQAMALAIRAAGFTPGEADQLRRAMAAWKRKGHLIKAFGEKIITGMLANGYSPEFAERCFNQIKGFGEYGFPESHAASFAIIVYVSAWLKRHHPAAFAAALINSQPMGFYAPAQIIRDAREHGVEVRAIDINASAWDCTLEDMEPASTLKPSLPDRRKSRGQGEGSSSSDKTKSRKPDKDSHDPASWGSNSPALRLGMRLVKGFSEDEAQRIAHAVHQHGPFETIDALWRRSHVFVKSLRALASADAFRSLGLDRQHALWQIRRLRDESLPLFDTIATRECNDNITNLPAIYEARKVYHDYAATGLSLKAHPMSFLRSRLDAHGVTPNRELSDPHLSPHGRTIAVAGLVLVRQRPGTASGIVFMTIEDETGIANLIFRPRVFDRYRSAARHGRILLARGAVERDSTIGRVVHVMVHHVEDIGRADTSGGPGGTGVRVPGVRLMQRNFH